MPISYLEKNPSRLVIPDLDILLFIASGQNEHLLIIAAKDILISVSEKLRAL